MRSIHLLKKSFFLSVLLLMLVLTFMSCKGKQEMDSKQTATELNKPNSDATKESDERFLVQAAEINLEEIMLAKLVQQRTGSEDVRALAKMLEDAHRLAKSNLSSLAFRKSIAVPTDPTKKVMELYDNLNAKSVKEFDQEYISLMVQGHKDAISFFEKYISIKNDPDINTWATTMIPELRDHLSKIMEVQAHMNPISERTSS